MKSLAFYNASQKHESNLLHTYRAYVVCTERIFYSPLADYTLIVIEGPAIYRVTVPPASGLGYFANKYFYCSPMTIGKH